MKVLTATQARTQFADLLDRAQREPVRIVRRNRLAAVMVSARDYEAMHAFYAERLLQRMAQTGSLSERAADRLLRGES